MPMHRVKGAAWAKATSDLSLRVIVNLIHMLLTLIRIHTRTRHPGCDIQMSRRCEESRMVMRMSTWEVWESRKAMITSTSSPGVVSVPVPRCVGAI